MASDPNARRDKALEDLSRNVARLTKTFEAINNNLVHVGRILERTHPIEMEGSNALE